MRDDVDVRLLACNRILCVRMCCPEAIIRMTVIAFALWIATVTVRAAEPLGSEAARLVRLALRAELHGARAERDQYLNAAIAADPNYAPARWHSGQVSIGPDDSSRNWLTIEAAELKAAEDPLRGEYEEVRRAHEDDLAGNDAIARWCLREGLDERARVHSARVLMFQPGYPAAIRRLKLRRYQGQWLTREQIDEVQAERARAVTLSRKWLPTLTQHRKAFSGKDAAAQQHARQELKRIASADLVGLMETQLSPRSRQLALAVVEAIGGVPDQAATESLVRHAVMSQWSSVRAAATNQLKDRPLHGFVPILIDGMMSPFEFQAWTDHSPLNFDYVLALNYAVGRKGKHSDQLLRGRVNMFGGWPNDNGATADRAEEIRDEIRERVEAFNEAAEEYNQPILETLQETTGQTLGSDPSQWNDWWNDFNEYLVPEFRPVFASLVRSASLVAVQPFTCFPGETLVSTETGRRPIKDIQVGDYVLSEDAESGELSYQPVLTTTTRESDAIVEIYLHGETIRATRGHPMWVNGRQWQMAKQLRRGDLLHGAKGPASVIALRGSSRKTTVFNLVVANTHTYFVGNSRVLVHDDSLYTPPAGVIPGE